MATGEREGIERAIELCRQAEEWLRPDAPFRLRVLLDMTLVELGKERARLGGGLPDGAGAPSRTTDGVTPPRS